MIIGKNSEFFVIGGGFTLEYALEIEELCKSFSKSRFALKNISFSVPYGSITGFIGENGAGKTSTMGAILQTLHIDSGSIKIFGERIAEAKKEINNHIGVVYDVMNFSGNLDVIKLSKVFRYLYRNWDNQEYFNYIELFSLPKKQKINSFSRGMAMKLSIAVALSHGARLLILDEATSGLDPVGREDVLEALLKFVRDQKGAILLSSHITSDIEKVADTLVFIKKGEIVLKTSKNDLLNNYAIIQCKEHELNDLRLNGIIAYKNQTDYVDVLVSNKNELPSKFHKKNFSIDDITLLLMKGENYERPHFK